MSSTMTTVCYLTSCQASEVDDPEDNFWPSKVLEINVKATFISSSSAQTKEAACCGSKKIIVVQEESHKLPLDQLLNVAAVGREDWQDTNIWDVFHCMQIPIQRSALDKIVGYALDMAAKGCYENRKVLRMQVEIETLVDDVDGEVQLDNFEELEDVYSIDIEADDFWETVEAFGRLRKMVVREEDQSNNNLCSICLVGFLVGSEVSATPCSHVFHDRCIRAWLKKCNTSKKFCPNCVTALA